MPRWVERFVARFEQHILVGGVIGFGGGQPTVPPMLILRTVEQHAQRRGLLSIAVEAPYLSGLGLLVELRHATGYPQAYLVAQEGGHLDIDRVGLRRIFFPVGKCSGATAHVSGCFQSLR